MSTIKKTYWDLYESFKVLDYTHYYVNMFQVSILTILMPLNPFCAPGNEQITKAMAGMKFEL